MIQAAIDFEAARRARDEGMARAQSHAEADAPGWSDTAYGFLLNHARATAQFTSYEFRQAMRIMGKPMPPTDKAFGPVFRRAAREGVIEKAGYTQHPERHCSPTPIWRSLVFGGSAA
jgi:hypothetical protein